MDSAFGEKKEKSMSHFILHVGVHVGSNDQLNITDFISFTPIYIGRQNQYNQGIMSDCE